jgi:hypothetical protein
MRSITTALVSYDAKYGAVPATSTALGGTCNVTNPPTQAASCLLATDMAAAIGTTPIQGYNLTYSQASSGSDFTLNSDPAAGVTNATKHFFADGSMTIRWNATAPASATDSPL